MHYCFCSLAGKLCATCFQNTLCVLRCRLPQVHQAQVRGRRAQLPVGSCRGSRCQRSRKRLEHHQPTNNYSSHRPLRWCRRSFSIIAIGAVHNKSCQLRCAYTVGTSAPASVFMLSRREACQETVNTNLPHVNVSGALIERC